MHLKKVIAKNKKMTDDTKQLYKTLKDTETDSAEPVVKYHSNDDNPCYTRNSITEILADYSRDIPANEHYFEAVDFWYYEIGQCTDWDFDDREITKPKIGCLYCHQEITLNSGCYIFCQTREEYDRNVSQVACSDVCPVAINQICKSKCQMCQRDYIRDRYDNDICRLCKNK